MYLKFIKPFLDFILSFIGLLLLSPFLILIWALLLYVHKANPIFFQKRVGQFGNLFTVFKFKTIKEKGQSNSLLKLLRKTKIDELPQLINVLKGEMSLVGPRPDIPGYYDLLKGGERQILQLKPGITGYASLKFINEEYILSQQKDKLRYNDEVIFPEKVKLNLYYYRNVSLLFDFKILLKTILLPLHR
ncbi:sugar transferase [Psychroflexus sediminis]|uniref:Sugar transferase involved in LPS biosynthesis (Colanic, teichoic acid) n=1 Tax=Psychroflexus sediminis TaxID=470826 RepID=A0A1G7VV65_9FLAO|nr:sugar transferase [Psychroflexus sediminis]SDG63587.1 Sugar transferase involved in LPS biosynthesis (colanic, teichoic acid) [Psychroflexus sediminis]